MQEVNFTAPNYVEAAGTRFAVYEAGPKTGRPILLLHGWPELAYSWKHIMPVLAQAGYRVIAPDLKGFGKTKGPDDLTAYAMDQLTTDFAALIQMLSLEKVVIMGHDWGGAIIWPMAYLYPQLIEGVIGICTPHRKTAPAAPLAIFQKQAGPEHYIVKFQDPDLPDRAFRGREDDFAKFIFQKARPRHLWPKLLPAALYLPARFARFTDLPEDKIVIPAADRAIFAESWRENGFRTSTHLYRNIDRNWRLSQNQDLSISQPVLMLSAELDMMLPPEAAEHMPELCADFQHEIIKDCGHWAMWDQPDEINRHSVDWLQARFPA
ncbi:MAG: alpha/beta fold hydrolase [bacterium]